MKILLLNPNTTADVTDLLHAAGSGVASDGTELVPMTAARGVPYIATRAEAQIGGAIALETAPLPTLLDRPMVCALLRSPVDKHSGPSMPRRISRCSSTTG